jgi:Xaa-Pro aminopeptidase
MLLPAELFCQRTGYTAEEFAARRARLFGQVSEGIIILFGECHLQPAAHFRQDNDFYYFTGVEDPHTILVMVPARKEAVLFLPRQTEREIRYEGANLLADPEGLGKSGLSGVYDLSYFDEYLSRMGSRTPQTMWIRLSPRDDVDNARWEHMLFIGRKNRIHYNAQISIDNYRIQQLKARYPVFNFKDVTPFIDELRLIKTAEEIEVMRRNGKLSAEAVKQAMLATRPGVFEYEIEAAAMGVILKGGAKGAAYPPIVGSGPNSCVLHYSQSSRQTHAGEVVLMDFGADLDYLCMDISRTWPVSGTFSDAQREAYRVALEVQKACIEAYRPGVTTQDVRDHVAEVMKKKSIDPRGQRGGIGHYVGMSVHDVGRRSIPLQEGMVFAIEPGLYYPEEGFGIRIEDTILITKDGCEVLTKDVPKEIDEVERLLKRRR